MDDDATIWSFDLVVDGSALAHGVLHFDKSHYDQSDELRPFGPPPKLTVRQAWVRPLGTVKKVEVDGMFQLISERSWFGLSEVVLTFEDDFEFRLPSQDPVHTAAARERSDDFHTAVRDAIGF